ncbi:MAG: hypothetical protein HQL10_12925 [Nitrospirae bacterium]|nr:hypothetical protein [Nitrospirota bacterium]
MLPVIIIGFSSLLMQVVCARVLLTIFSGNELVICITLASWLLSVCAGSFCGLRFKARNAFVFSFLAVALLSPLTVFSIQIYRLFAASSGGEVVSLVKTAAFSFCVLSPLCFVFGMQFPLASERLNKKASGVYWIEACGAFAAGILFVFVFSVRFDSSFTAAFVAVLNILTFAALSRRKIFLMFLIIPILFYFGEQRLSAYSLPNGMTVVERLESKYGEISVTKLAGQMNIYVSGGFAFAYPDMINEERSHITMTAHELPAKVLVIGGSPAIVRELLKYPVENIDFLELDPMLLDLSKRILSHEDRLLLSDKRVSFIAQDGRRFIKTVKGQYDVIVLNMQEPSTAAINRFYTTDFFIEAKTALNNGGVLALSLPLSHGYIGKRVQMANGAVYRSLEHVFRHIEVSSEEYGIMLASDSPVNVDPHFLEQYFNDRGIKTVHFRGVLFYDAFDKSKTEAVKNRLSRVDILNTDRRPIAYFYNLVLWTDIHGGKVVDFAKSAGGFLFMAALLALSVAAVRIFFREYRPLYFSLFTTGYVSMAFSVVVILGFQSAFGFVYERIGLLSAVFMAGLGAGALFGERRGFGISQLKYAEILSGIFFLAAAYMLRNELSFYLLAFLCGIIGGIQFAAAAASFGENYEYANAGKLYAVDISGAFAGALATALVTVPVCGIENTFFVLAFMKILSLAFLLSAGHEKA